MAAFFNKFYKATITAASRQLWRYLSPAAPDKYLTAADPIVNNCLLKTCQQRLALFQHDIDLVGKVIVLDSRLRMPIYLKLAVPDCNTCPSVFNDAGAANDVDFSELLLFDNEAHFYALQYLRCKLLVQLIFFCVFSASEANGGASTVDMRAVNSVGLFVTE